MKRPWALVALLGAGVMAVPVVGGYRGSLGKWENEKKMGSKMGSGKPFKMGSGKPFCYFVVSRIGQ